jgi:hypothetical protein
MEAPLALDSSALEGTCDRGIRGFSSGSETFESVLFLLGLYGLGREESFASWKKSRCPPPRELR